ncbi:TPA: hypothetical protein DF272_00025 [Candidatus Falkowbacteria bacterium]|nr:hypothetical protein [Candidatus Falkowbacteria bacterium]
MGRTADFTYNQFLREYLIETGVDLEDAEQLRTFAQKVTVRVDLIKLALDMKQGVAERFLARLYLATGDRRFAPTTKVQLNCVKKFAAEFRRNPGEFSVDDKARQMLLQSNPRFEANRTLITLLKKYGYKRHQGPRTKESLAKHLDFSPSIIGGIINFKTRVVGSTKAKLFLAFGHPVFAPINEDETRFVEEFKEKIAKLPFVDDNEDPLTDLSQASSNKTNDEKPSITPQLIDVNEVISSLLNSPEFWTKLTEKMTEVKPTTEQTEPAFEDTEIASAEFLEKTAALIKETISRIQALAQMVNRRETTRDAQSALKQLEKQLSELFLNVRAFGKTSTGKAFQEMLKQEGTFLNRWKPGEEQND